MKTPPKDSLVEYGIILLSMKEYQESLDTFREAFHLRQREAHLARKPELVQEAKLKMAKIRHNIGCVNFELGRLDDAKASYIDAIEQQKAAFGTWSTPFMIMTDMTKPGFLTMASTMCNKGKISPWLLAATRLDCAGASLTISQIVEFPGYIDLEQEYYNDAIVTFNESLKVRTYPWDMTDPLLCFSLTDNNKLRTVSDPEITP